MVADLRMDKAHVARPFVTAVVQCYYVPRHSSGRVGVRLGCWLH
jgi:hypothetical protein